MAVVIRWNEGEANLSPQMMVKHCYRGTKNVHGVVEKVDNGSQKYYKEEWHGGNPFISSTFPFTGGEEERTGIWHELC